MKSVELVTHPDATGAGTGSIMKGLVYHGPGQRALPQAYDTLAHAAKTSGALKVILNGRGGD